ncbi:MAG: hypothetical protein JRF05_04500 [Deltaproteobacteria bacterium]|jgi:hypothetical protein|nr:hypothetical protein [Deltaproteobacteria bacterium]
MTDTNKENSQSNTTGKETCERPQEQMHKPGNEESPQENSARFREASYVVLFIAAVFVVNAMETGSYRTPWPVAIITTLTGLGLFGYSWYLQSHPDK